MALKQGSHALHTLAGTVDHYPKQPGTAVGEVNHLPVQRAHLVAVHPHLADTGAVDPVGEPEERGRNGRDLVAVGGGRHPVIISFVHEHHRGGGHVIALLVGGGYHAGLGVYPEVGSPEAGGVRFHGPAIRGYLQDGAIVRGAGPESHQPLGRRGLRPQVQRPELRHVKAAVRRYNHVAGPFPGLDRLGHQVGEILVIVGHAIPVEVMKTHDSFFPVHIEATVDYLNALGLVESGGIAPPL